MYLINNTKFTGVFLIILIYVERITHEIHIFHILLILIKMYCGKIEILCNYNEC